MVKNMLFYEFVLWTLLIAYFSIFLKYLSINYKKN